MKRGSIAFFGTYRPPVPLGIYSCPIPPASVRDERPLLDGSTAYDCNAHAIPKSALKALLTRPDLASLRLSAADVDSGRVSGLVFVSERTDNLETLHIAVRFRDGSGRAAHRVFSFAALCGTFNGVRLEDSGCFAGEDLVYVSTMQPAAKRREPWTAVYKTNLRTGKTERLTPTGQSDLSPAVSPSGKRIAVASFEQKERGWDGAIEDMKTNIFIMNVERPHDRKLFIRNGGWPTWGSDDVLFFHRKDDPREGNVADKDKFWHVFRADISSGPVTDRDCVQVTPARIDAVTPAALDADRVAVATIRQKSGFSDVRVEAQYRHIEIFSSAGGAPVQITQKTRPKADHYNPFVVVEDGKRLVGYHRTRSETLKSGDDVPRELLKLQSPTPDVEVIRVPGVFPSFSTDGTKLAFVDNEFKAVWVADSRGLRVVYETEGPDNVFYPVWNQNPDKDILYVCRGPSFHFQDEVNICAIPVAAEGRQTDEQLTDGHNNAFPYSNPEGTKLVFRSTRGGSRNLYIMEDAEVGEFGGEITRITNGKWVDSHCQWSPNGEWIVFASTHDKPDNAPPFDNGLDPGYYAIFLLKVSDPSVWIRVIGSGDDLAGHVNHPAFSPDGKSIVFVSDIAAVSCDPISLPLFVHSVRPYGDIFTVDIDWNDVSRNKDVKRFTRITHSKYENSTASWTLFSTKDPKAAWNLLYTTYKGSYKPECPHFNDDGSESNHMLGHLCIPKRCC